MDVAARIVIWVVVAVIILLVVASCLSFWYILRSEYAKAFKILRFFPYDNSAAVRPIDITFIAILGNQLKDAEKRIEKDMAMAGVQPLTLSLRILLLAKQGKWDETKELVKVLKQMMIIEASVTDEDKKGLEILSDAISTKDIKKLERLGLYEDHLLDLKRLIRKLSIIISFAIVALIAVVIYEVVN